MQAEAAEVKPSAEIVQLFKKIEGGRTLDAMKVRELIDERVGAVRDQFEHPSGFFAVVWDDEGFAAATLVRGNRFPLMPATLKSEVAELLSQQCQFPMQEDDDE